MNRAHSVYLGSAQYELSLFLRNAVAHVLDDRRVLTLQALELHHLWQGQIALAEVGSRVRFRHAGR